MKKKFLKFMSTLMVLVCLTMSLPLAAFASQTTSNVNEANYEWIFEENPELAADRENITVIPVTIVPESNKNARDFDLYGSTTGWVFLHNRTGGVEGLYRMTFHWKGDLSLSKITGKIAVRSTSSLYPEVYANKTVNINCGGSTSGSADLGSFTIPTDVDRVRVAGNDMKVYVNNASNWYSFSLSDIVDL